MFKKHYVANIVDCDKRSVIGSAIISVNLWRSAGFAYSKMSNDLNNFATATDRDLRICDFKRVK